MRAGMIFFWGAGAALVGSGVGWLVWLATINPFHHPELIRIGLSGFTAVSLWWAARASSYVSAAVRAGLLGLVVVVAHAAAYDAAFMHHGAMLELFGHRFGEPPPFVPINEFQVVVESPDLVAVFSATIGMGVAGALSRGAVAADAQRTRTGVLAAVLVVWFGIAAVTRLVDGAEVAAVVAVIAAAWLAWGLRRLRAAPVTDAVGSDHAHSAPR